MIDKYTLHNTPEEFGQFLDIKISEDYVPTYNAFPTRKMPIITNENPAEVSYFYWGQTPQWSNNKKLSSRYYNVPVDQLTQKNAYKNAFKNTRCVVPMSGFYLWKKVGKKTVIPHYYYQSNHEVMAAAGIWEEYTDFEEHQYFTFNLIIKTNDSDQMSDMVQPIILKKEALNTWLSRESDPEILEKLISENSNISLHSHTVSPLIGRVDIDNSTLIAHQPPSDQHGNFTLFG